MTVEQLALAASVRTAVESAASADSLCRAFPTGGGRTGAAGINRLPRDDLDRFIAAFRVWSATGQPGAAE